MRILRTALFFLFSLMLCQTIDCQDLQLNLNNIVSFRNFQYVKSTDDITNIAELRSEHSFKLKYKDGLAANLSARGRYNYLNRSRSRMYWNEAYVSVNKGKLELKIGKQIVKYGNLAGISNLDQANSYDYFDFLDTDQEEVSQWGLTSKVKIKKVQFDFKYIYKLDPSIVYFADNQWVKLPRQINHPSEVGVVIPIQLQSIINVNSDVRRNSLNLGLDLELGGLVARIDYYNGYNDIPFRKFDLDLFSQNSPIDFNLELSIQPLSLYNLNVQKTIGSWNTWVEFGFINNKFSKVDGSVESDNYKLFSLGVNRLFLFDESKKLLKLGGQWRHALWNGKFDYNAKDLDHVLDRCFIINLYYQHTYDLSFACRTFLSYSGLGFYLSPSIRYMVTKKIMLSGGYDLLAGNEGHFFGQYAKDDRFIFKIQLQL